MNHEIRVERPAFEKRHDDPRRDYGIGCVLMSFTTTGDHGAVSLEVLTGWYLPHVAERLRKETQHHTYPDGKAWMPCHFEGMGGRLEIHSDHPLWEAQEPITDQCRFTGGPCWNNIGYIIGETLFGVLVAEGQDALFAALDEQYRCHVEATTVAQLPAGD